jgi:hypothetical protein
MGDTFRSLPTQRSPNDPRHTPPSECHVRLIRYRKQPFSSCPLQHGIAIITPKCCRSHKIRPHHHPFPSCSIQVCGTGLICRHMSWGGVLPLLLMERARPSLASGLEGRFLQEKDVVGEGLLVERRCKKLITRLLCQCSPNVSTHSELMHLFTNKDIDCDSAALESDHTRFVTSLPPQWPAVRSKAQIHVGGESGPFRRWGGEAARRQQARHTRREVELVLGSCPAQLEDQFTWSKI